eukprot:Nk52_evm2s39 gene=Nk52_evmTU2s39
MLKKRVELGVLWLIFLVNICSHCAGGDLGAESGQGSINDPIVVGKEGGRITARNVSDSTISNFNLYVNRNEYLDMVYLCEGLCVCRPISKSTNGSVVQWEVKGCSFVYVLELEDVTLADQLVSSQQNHILVIDNDLSNVELGLKRPRYVPGTGEKITEQMVKFTDSEFLGIANFGNFFDQVVFSTVETFSVTIGGEVMNITNHTFGGMQQVQNFTLDIVTDQEYVTFERLAADAFESLGLLRKLSISCAFIANKEVKDCIGFPVLKFASDPFALDSLVIEGFEIVNTVPGIVLHCLFPRTLTSLSLKVNSIEYFDFTCPTGMENLRSLRVENTNPENKVVTSPLPFFKDLNTLSLRGIRLHPKVFSDRSFDNYYKQLESFELDMPYTEYTYNFDFVKFQKLESLYLRSFDMANGSLPMFNSAVKATMKNLSVIECGITGIPDGYVLEMPELRDLNLSNNLIQSVSGQFGLADEVASKANDSLASHLCLKQDYQLISLDISLNMLEALTNHMFCYARMIGVISLNGNQIRNWSSKAFGRHDLPVSAGAPWNMSYEPQGNETGSLGENNDLMRCSYIDLSNNSLTEIPVNAINGLMEVDLNIDDNHISHLRHSLCEMCSIKRFSITHNKLQLIEPEVFKNILPLFVAKEIIEVDVSHNPILNLGAVTNIISSVYSHYSLWYNRFAIRAQHCNLNGRANLYTFKQCGHLDLSHNRISSVRNVAPLFRHQGLVNASIPLLRVLRLEHNIISELPPSVFTVYPKLEHLDLSFNNLSFIASNLLTSVNADIAIANFSHNAISKIEDYAFNESSSNLVHNGIGASYDFSYNALEDITTCLSLGFRDAGVMLLLFKHNPIKVYPSSATAPFFSQGRTLGILSLEGTKIEVVDSPFCENCDEANSGKTPSDKNPTFVLSLRNSPLRLIQENAMFCRDQLLMLDASNSNLLMLPVPRKSERPNIVSLNVRNTGVQSLPADFMSKSTTTKFLSMDDFSNCCTFGASNLDFVSLYHTQSEIPQIDLLSMLFESPHLTNIFSKVTTLLQQFPGFPLSGNPCNYSLSDGNTVSTTLEHFYKGPPGMFNFTRSCSCSHLNCNLTSSQCVVSKLNEGASNEIDTKNTCLCKPVRYWGDGFVCVPTGLVARQPSEDKLVSVVTCIFLLVYIVSSVMCCLCSQWILDWFEATLCNTPVAVCEDSDEDEKKSLMTLSSSEPPYTQSTERFENESANMRTAGDALGYLSMTRSNGSLPSYQGTEIEESYCDFPRSTKESDDVSSGVYAGQDDFRPGEHGPIEYYVRPFRVPSGKLDAKIQSGAAENVWDGRSPSAVYVVNIHSNNIDYDSSYERGSKLRSQADESGSHTEISTRNAKGAFRTIKPSDRKGNSLKVFDRGSFAFSKESMLSEGNPGTLL